MKIKIWGARGSLPSPLKPEAIEARIKKILDDAAGVQALGTPGERETYLKGLPRSALGGFGGNTPCVEVNSGATRLIVDAGSGIRELGYQLMSGPCGQGQGEVHLLFTHFHWDHLIGLPFFVPIFIPGNTIHVYSVQPELEAVFKTLFQKPYFPVPLENLAAKIVYHRLEPRQKIKIQEIALTPYQLDHPDPCWGYKFESDGKTYSHCVDTECTRVSREALGPDLPLYQNVDLMLFDAQYTLIESIDKVNWGHAAAALGIDIALREKIRRVLFIHHDPASNDEKIALAEKEARRYYMAQIRSAKNSGETLPEINWEFAWEGMEIEL